MKKETQIALGVFGLAALFIAAIFLVARVRKKYKNNDSTLNEDSMVVEPVSGSVAIGVVAIKILVSAGIITVGAGVGVAAYYYRDSMKQNIQKVDKSDLVDLNKIKTDIQVEIERLAATHENIQENRKSIYNYTIKILSFERRYINFTLKALEEKVRAPEQSGFDKFINLIDVANVIKPKEMKIQEKVTQKFRNEEIVKSNQEEAKLIAIEIAKLKKAIEGAKEKVLKDLEYVVMLLKSIEDHKENYETKRSKMISEGLISHTTPNFVHENANCIELINASKKLLAETRDQEGKLSSIVACGHGDVLRAAVHNKREYGKIKDKKRMIEILEEEAEGMNGIRKKEDLPSFYEVININTLPASYDPSKPALLYNRDDVGRAIGYLESERRVFNDPKKTQLALEGKKDIFYECIIAIDKNVQAIKWTEENEQSPNLNLNGMGDVGKVRTVS